MRIRNIVTANLGAVVTDPPYQARAPPTNDGVLAEVGDHRPRIERADTIGV